MESLNLSLSDLLLTSKTVDHGRNDMKDYVSDNIEDAYVEMHSKTYVRSNFLRTQIGGIYEVMKAGNDLVTFQRRIFIRQSSTRRLL